MRNAQGVWDADSVRTAGSKDRRLSPCWASILGGCTSWGMRGVTREIEMGSARLRAERQAHIRQWGAGARKRRFDVHGEVSSCRWVPYGLQPRRRTGRAVPGRPDMDESDPGLGCLDRHPRGSACARPCHPPGGSLPSESIPGGKAIE